VALAAVCVGIALVNLAPAHRAAVLTIPNAAPPRDASTPTRTES